MRIAIVGSGALGGLFGSLLARKHHDVSLLVRPVSVDRLRNGFTIATASESFASGPLPLFTDARDIGPVDLVMVAVKAWQVAALTPSLKPLVGAQTIVVPLQNGLEAADLLAASLGEAAVVGGVCHVLARRPKEPTHVTVGGAPPHVSLGERPRGRSPRLEAIAIVLREAGATVTVTDDIGAILWSKLLFVEPFGSVGAASRSPVEVVRSTPETRALLEGAMREVRAIATAIGVKLRDDVIEDAMTRIDAMPEGATSSMHRDLVEGRPSELDDQTGAVIRAGKRARIATPIHDVLWASLLPQDVRLSPRT